MRKTNSISNRQKHQAPHNYCKQILQCLPGGAALSTTNSLNSMQRVVQSNHSTSPSSHSPNNILSLHEALLTNTHLRRMFDYHLSKTLGMESLAMEEKIKSMSKFVLKESFDLGLEKFYSRVAHHVDAHLRSKGIQIQESQQLKREKEVWWRKRLELLHQRNERDSQNRRSKENKKNKSSKCNHTKLSLPSLSMHTSGQTTAKGPKAKPQKQDPPFMYQRMNLRHKIRRSQYEHSENQNQTLFILNDL